MSIGFVAFAVTENGERTVAEGPISIEIDTRDPTVTTITVSTDTLVTTTAGEEQVLTSFTVRITEDSSMFPTA